MYCSNCGTENNSTAKFCKNCGAKLKEETPTSWKCSSCGEMNDAGSKFCSNCGASFTDEESSQYSSQTFYDDIGKTGYDYTGAQQEQSNQSYSDGQVSKEIVPVFNRSIALYIVLDIITFGIFGWYWLYKLSNDVNNLSGVDDTSGGLVVLFSIITFNIYTVYWAYKCGEKLVKIKALRGEHESDDTKILFLVLTLLFSLGDLIVFAIVQSEINQHAE